MNANKINNLPTQPGYYWCQRIETPYIKGGVWEVCLLYKGVENFYAEGFGEMELEEIGYNWHRIYPPPEK